MGKVLLNSNTMKVFAVLALASVAMATRLLLLEGWCEVKGDFTLTIHHPNGDSKVRLMEFTEQHLSCTREQKQVTYSGTADNGRLVDLTKIVSSKCLAGMGSQERAIWYHKKERFGWMLDLAPLLPLGKRFSTKPNYGFTQGQWEKDHKNSEYAAVFGREGGKCSHPGCKGRFGSSPNPKLRPVASPFRMRRMGRRPALLFTRMGRSVVRNGYQPASKLPWRTATPRRKSGSSELLLPTM